MKIAVLAHLKFPIAQPFAGGLEMHTHILARKLIARGHDVTLFAAQGSAMDLGLQALCDPTDEGHGDATKQARVDAAEAAAYRSMMEQVAQGGFELIHNNSLHFHPLQVAGRLDAPMVTSLHTPPFEPLADAMHRADTTIVSVSNYLATLWTGLPGPLKVIPNGIDLGAFRDIASSPGCHAIWSGRIVPEKGLHLAIDAARLAKIPLVFAGPRADGAYWDEQIAPRLGSDLTDLGHLAHADLARRVASAAVAIVSPCWDEPFGLVVAEALACGTPVAAFARGAIPSLVDARFGALARPGDAADLARAITDALRCDRHACRGYAELMFDSERMIDSYEELYRQVIAGEDGDLAVPAYRPPGRGVELA